MKIAVAMSGGVDSATAAYLLKQSGHEVIGFFMHLNVPAGHAATTERRCCSLDDARDAQRCADVLGIDFYALPYRDHFARIIRDFVDEYRAGRTPYPCVTCNQDLKFGALLELAEGIGAEAVATGHYARLEGGRLRRAVDPEKDQSYVLFGLRPDQLARARFPVGGYTKVEIRAFAREAGLPVEAKPDSQDLCFIPRGTVGDFLRKEAPETARPGPIVDVRGQVLGEHPGVAFFTVGQRKGLGALGEARYVLRLEPATNTVVAGTWEDLMQASFTVDRVNWLGGVPEAPVPARVQIRYHHQAAPATVTLLPDGKARVAFEVPQAAVTPGQVAVFYDAVLGEEVLGGGWIEGAALPPPATAILSRTAAPGP